MLHTLHPSPPSLYSRWAPLESVLGEGDSTSGSGLVYMYRLSSVLQDRRSLARLTRHRPSRVVSVAVTVLDLPRVPLLRHAAFLGLV